jgi:hypothetical protein
MTKSTNVAFLKGVADILNSYPPINEIIGPNSKFVLVYIDTSDLLYNFLVNKHFAVKNEIPFLLPNIREDNNATFIFYHHDFYCESEVHIATFIYLRREIFYQRNELKVLDGSTLVTNDFCDHCLGYYYCTSLDLGPCFAKNSKDFALKLDKRFFKFLNKQLKFENVDLTSYEWKIQPVTLLMVLRLHEDISSEIYDFATSVCTNLAPEKAYKTNNITMQNETYTRLQMTHQFRYDQSDVFLLPDNFEEVFHVSSIFLNLLLNCTVNFFKVWYTVKKHASHAILSKKNIKIMRFSTDLLISKQICL